MEVAIGVLIMAIAVAVVLPSLSNVSRAELRKGARMLAGHIRETFDEAALNGETYRMVFTFGDNTVKVQATEAVLLFAPGSNALIEAGQSARAFDAELDGAGDGGEENADLVANGASTPMSMLLGLGHMGRTPLAGQGQGFRDVGQFRLGEGIRLLDVWLEGMSQSETEGVVYLVFFPHGYTQEAIVNIESDDGAVFAVKVMGLTGRTVVDDHYLEAQP